MKLKSQKQCREDDRCPDSEGRPKPEATDMQHYRQLGEGIAAVQALPLGEIAAAREAPRESAAIHPLVPPGGHRAPGARREAPPSRPTVPEGEGPEAAALAPARPHQCQLFTLVPSSRSSTIQRGSPWPHLAMSVLAARPPRRTEKGN